VARLIIFLGAAFGDRSLPVTLTDDKAAMMRPAILPGDNIREPAGMQWFINALREHPELALFLTLAIGHGAGHLRLGSFQVGPVLGSLFAGVLVGQLHIPVPEALKNTLFLLFLLAIGYNTGPLFFRGLKSTAGPQIGLTLLLCVTALLTAWAVSLVLGFDAGAAGGLVAGAMTSAAALGTASDAVLNLDLDPAQLASAAARQTVAFAVTYLLGMSLVVWLLAHLAPRLLGVDLAAECRRLEVEMGIDDRGDDALTAYSAVVARAYAIPSALAGSSVADLEALFAGQRVFVERVRHEGGVIEEPSAALRLATGDRVVLSARLELLTGAANPLHEHEVDDR
jgi:putative transport protein